MARLGGTRARGDDLEHDREALQAQRAAGVVGSRREHRGRDGRRGFSWSFKRRRGWGRDDLPGVGGGHGGTVGGARGTSSNRVAGAVGHQRHIDHVFVARGDGVRDDTRADVQCRARCVRAFVRVDTNSETFRRRGESRCACGAHAVGGPMSETCACHDVDGVWASDHFPVAADLRLSWSVDEGEPVRRFRSTRPHTP